MPCHKSDEFVLLGQAYPYNWIDASLYMCLQYTKQGIIKVHSMHSLFLDLYACETPFATLLLWKN